MGNYYSNEEILRNIEFHTLCIDADEFERLDKLNKFVSELYEHGVERWGGFAELAEESEVSLQEEFLSDAIPHEVSAEHPRAHEITYSKYKGLVHSQWLLEQWEENSHNPLSQWENYESTKNCSCTLG